MSLITGQTYDEYVAEHILQPLGIEIASASVPSPAMRLMWGEDPDPLPSFASPVHVEVEIDPEIFDQYVGDYQLSPELVLTITREGSRFFGQATNQPRIEIFASSEVSFFLKAIEATMTFGRDDPDGPVTHMLFRQSEERRAPRINLGPRKVQAGHLQGKRQHPNRPCRRARRTTDSRATLWRGSGHRQDAYATNKKGPME